MATAKREPEEVLGMSAEEVAANESDIIAQLLDAASFKEDAHLMRRAKIVRRMAGVGENGEAVYEDKEVISFRVRPVTEVELSRAKKAATSYMPNPQNPKLPKIEKSRDQTLYNSWVIYLATVDEDKARIWDNKAAWNALNQQRGFDIKMAVDMVDAILLAGEKDQVVDLISSLSGYDTEITEYAGN